MANYRMTGISPSNSIAVDVAKGILDIATSDGVRDMAKSAFKATEQIASGVIRVISSDSTTRMVKDIFQSFSGEGLKVAFQSVKGITGLFAETLGSDTFSSSVIDIVKGITQGSSTIAMELTRKTFSSDFLSVGLMDIAGFLKPMISETIDMISKSNNSDVRMDYSKLSSFSLDLEQAIKSLSGSFDVWMGLLNVIVENKALTGQFVNKAGDATLKIGQLFTKFSEYAMIMLPQVISMGEALLSTDTKFLSLDDNFNIVDYKGAAPDPKTVPTSNGVLTSKQDVVDWAKNNGASGTQGQCLSYAEKRAGIDPVGVNSATDAYNNTSKFTEKGHSVSTTPEAGTVLLSDGHAMYVESKNADGTINISESNYGVSQGKHEFNYRTIEPPAGGKYISA